MTINEDKFKDMGNTFELDLYHRCNETVKKLFELTSNYIINNYKVSYDFEYNVAKLNIDSIFHITINRLVLLISDILKDLSYFRIEKKFNYEHLGRDKFTETLREINDKYLKYCLTILQERSNI